MNDARREFAKLAAKEPVPLARGALLIAKEEYPDLDIDEYLDKLATLAREAEPIVRAGEDTVERVQLLSHFLFELKGFEGNAENYNDPRNSFLNDVINRRLGTADHALAWSISKSAAGSASIFTASRSPIISWSRRWTSAAS